MCCETMGRTTIEHVGEMVGVFYNLTNGLELKP